MNKTAIEYLTHTWNPIAMRCTPVSEGCANCWHLSMANRMASNPSFSPDVKAAYAGDSFPVIVPKRLKQPLNRKKPARIGVQFMGDLFHEEIPYCMIEDVFRVVQRTPQHMYLILTKRPAKMQVAWETFIQTFNDYRPLSNVWLGVTAENQRRAEERIPTLLRIPAVVRFVSVEPMLESIDIEEYLLPQEYYVSLAELEHFADSGTRYTQGIDWVICGCESGARRRHIDIESIRHIKNQCVKTDTPFFLKQMEIDNTIVKMPELDGQIWDQLPEV